mgnify:CR=1 FL=1
MINSAPILWSLGPDILLVRLPRDTADKSADLEIKADLGRIQVGLVTLISDFEKLKLFSSIMSRASLRPKDWKNINIYREFIEKYTLFEIEGKP